MDDSHTCDMTCHHALRIMETWDILSLSSSCPYIKHVPPYFWTLLWMFLFFSSILNWWWTHRHTPVYSLSLSRWLLRSSAGEITLRRILLCANLINALSLPSFVPPWCKPTINHLHKAPLWDNPGKNSWHVQSSTLPFSPPLDAYDFRQECFIWILYYMCCPKDLKGGFNMWILCSVACETSMRHTEKCWHLQAQMHFAGSLVVKWSIQDGTSEVSYCCCGERRKFCFLLLSVMFFLWHMQ